MSGHFDSTVTETETSNTVTVQFNPLLASHNGIYTCQVSIQSPALSPPITTSSVFDITIQCKYCDIIIFHIFDLLLLFLFQYPSQMLTLEFMAIPHFMRVVP